MDDRARLFFENLVAAPGVSGFEQPVQRVVREYAAPFAEQIQTDLHGNLILSVNRNAATRVLLAGHADQIGLIVSYIDDNGYLFTQTVGGWDPQQLVGQKLTVWGKDGPVPGVIARKPIHLLEEAEKNKVVNPKSMWIDIGAADRKQAESQIDVGSSVTLKAGIVWLNNDLASGPAMDNRSGLWVVVEAMRRAVLQGVSCGLFVASTVQEEIGLRGAQTAAYSVDPQIGIAVDVTHATDCPESDSKQQGSVGLGKGPVIVRGPNMNAMVCNRLEQCAAGANITVQRSALGRAASNDSNVLQITRGGVATAVVAIPNRYMHSAVETISMRDIDDAAQLLANFVCGVTTHDEFIPI